jgi:hypothetical protein
MSLKIDASVEIDSPNKTIIQSYYNINNNLS